MFRLQRKKISFFFLADLRWNWVCCSLPALEREQSFMNCSSFIMRKKQTDSHITSPWLQYISKCIEPVNGLRFNDRPMEPSKSDPGLLQGQERALKLRLGAGCQQNIWWRWQRLWPAGWSLHLLFSLIQFHLPGLAVQGSGTGRQNTETTLI